MFNEEEQATGLGGVTVQDAWVGMQLLEKAASRGVIQPNEFAVMANWRESLVGAIQRAIGKNYDEEVQKAIIAQQQAAQAQQQAAAEAFRAQQAETAAEVEEEAAAVDGAETIVEKTFYFPLLAHAPMEPLNCTIEQTLIFFSNLFSIAFFLHEIIS